jgi:hypothetical protein
MDVYNKTNMTHINLINLGKEMNEKDTIKKNSNEYLEKAIKSIKIHSEHINLKNSYESILTEIQKNNYVFSIKIEELILAIYLLKLRCKNYKSEIKILKETEENINESYENVIEELEEKEEELKVEKEQNQKIKIYGFIFFVLYNYMLLFSLYDIYNQIISVINLIITFGKYIIYFIITDYKTILTMMFIPFIYIIVNYNKKKYLFNKFKRQ